MKCIVGNCMTPEDRVERCYWNNYWSKADDVIANGNAYLDLCGFHQSFFCTKKTTTTTEGWDKC